MAMHQELQARQSIKLALTPEMRQSISILQMTSVELKEYIEAEMQENPLLEYDESKMRESEQEENNSVDWKEYFKSVNSVSDYYSGEHKDHEEYSFEDFSYKEMAYNEYLDMQFHLIEKKLTAIQKKAGLALLDAINDDGYLVKDLMDLEIELGIPENEIEEVLMMIQHFDPSGTGARNVRECICLQLRDEGILNDELKHILEEYLEDMAENSLKKISVATKIPVERLKEYRKYILAVNPRPGSAFAVNKKSHYIVPDGSIHYVNNEAVVHVNEIGAPHLMLNKYYMGMLMDDNCQEEVREYINQKLERGRLMIRNIESRRDTICKITTAIAEIQKDYLTGRIESLNALTLKQVAAIAGVHESTVSRTVRGKYFITPRGTVELKFFFSSGYKTESGSISSSDAIKNKIRSLIEKEDKGKPLSDQIIADMISDNELKIARRTVAKYREEMGFPSSAKRRK